MDQYKKKEEEEEVVDTIIKAFNAGDLHGYTRYGLLYQNKGTKMTLKKIDLFLLY